MEPEIKQEFATLIKAVERMSKDLKDLEIEIARLNSKIDLATQGRTSWKE
jgi:hypothetical protein